MEAATVRLQQRHHAHKQLCRMTGGTAQESRLDALSRTKILCQCYKEGKNVGSVYTELLWNRSCVLNSYTLIPELLSCEDEPSKGQPHWFSFQNLTCLKPPRHCFCGFMMRIFLVFLRDRNKQGTWLGSCRGMERTQNATLKHGENSKEPFLNLPLFHSESTSRLGNFEGSPGTKLKMSH